MNHLREKHLFSGEKISDHFLYVIFVPIQERRVVISVRESHFRQEIQSRFTARLRLHRNPVTVHPFSRLRRHFI